MVTEAVPPELSVTLVVLRVDVGQCALEGSMLEDRLIVPVKPLRLVSVMIDVPGVPRERVIVAGLAAIEKSWVVKTAVCTFSGTPVGDPFEMVTHVVVPETLLLEQPV